jgi:hypothetical protein
MRRTVRCIGEPRLSSIAAKSGIEAPPFSRGARTPRAQPCVTEPGGKPSNCQFGAYPWRPKANGRIPSQEADEHEPEPSS